MNISALAVVIRAAVPFPIKSLLCVLLCIRSEEYYYMFVRSVLTLYPI